MIHRRNFLQHLTACAALGPGLLQNIVCAQTSANPKRKMTIDLSCGNIGVRANQLEAIELAHRFGFESVAADAGYLASLPDEKLPSIRELLKEKKLRWGAAGMPVDFRSTPENFEKSIKTFPKIAGALQRAGVTRFGTWLSPGHARLTYLENFKLHTARVRQIAQVLVDHGQRLGLEYVGPKTSWTRQRFPFIHTMAEMKELISEIDLKNVGFVLDSWHWYTAGETGAELQSLTNEQVIAVDLNDAPAGLPVDQQFDGRRELPSATGVIDLATFLNSLNRMAYDGPVRAEPFNKTLNDLGNDDACAATIAAMRKAFALIVDA